MGIRCLNANHPNFQLEVQLELELESKLEHTLLSNQTERRWRAMTNGKLKLNFIVMKGVCLFQLSNMGRLMPFV